MLSNGISLSAYGCGISYVVYPAVQPLTSLPTYSNNYVPSLTSAMPSLPTSTSPASSSASADKRLSHGDIAGIAIGAYYSAAIFASCLTLLVCYKRRRRNLLQLPAIDIRELELPRTPPELPRTQPELPRIQPQELSSATALFALDGVWRLEPFLRDTMDEVRFMGFLISFGSDGILLRELIMLASLRLATKTSRNHWLANGERGRLQDAINAHNTYAVCPFLGAFMREASNVQSIEIFQARLEKLGLVNVDYQYARGTHLASQQSWFMDGRIWRMDQSRSYARSSRPQLLLDVFLEVFTEMPCKDISPLAERQREIYYYHAHRAIVYLYKNRLLWYVHPRNMNHLVLVMLQILSHRFQNNDEALLRFVKANLPESGLHPDWNMILLVAELKATISTNPENLLQIRDEVFQAVEISGTRDSTSPRARGLSGWLLVELLDAAEAQDCTELIDDAVRTGKQWMQSLLGSELSCLEQTMLCRAFARFRTSDDPKPQPRQYNLLFGYQLSRAGCIEKAEEILLSGLEYYAPSPMSTRIWSYRFELVSLMLRAGRWSEAEAWLAIARKSAISRSRVIHETDFWKRSGECGETFVLLGLYQADCDIAMGKLKPAEDRLKETMERTLFVRDSYIRALRLALRTRLLNVQMWQEMWERATVTAQDLIEDTIASGDCLSTTRSSCSVVVIVLTLINKLLWVGDVLGAARLLKSIRRFEDTEYPVLPLDIKLYLERRRAAVSHFLSLEGSSEYIRHLEDSGADAENAMTFAPIVDQLYRNPNANPSGAQEPTLVNFGAQATETMPSHAGRSPLKQSPAYKWSLELEHARFPTPEVEELDHLKVQSHEAEVRDTRDNVSAQTAKAGESQTAKAEAPQTAKAEEPQTAKAEVPVTRLNPSVGLVHHEVTRRRRMHTDPRRGTVHRGSPFVELLAQAPRPPTHEPFIVNSPTYRNSAELGSEDSTAKHGEELPEIMHRPYRPYRPPGWS